MKNLAITTVAALCATPALAHGGAHFHPHGSEPFLALGLLAAIGVLVMMRIKR